MTFDFSNFLLTHTEKHSFAGICNCRMAAYFVQDGRCFVTGRELKPYHRELHHRLPRQYGGKDIPANTVLLDKSVHRLIHANHPDEIYSLLMDIKPTDEELNKINQLRLEAKRMALNRRRHSLTP